MSDIGGAARSAAVMIDAHAAGVHLMMMMIVTSGRILLEEEGDDVLVEAVGESNAERRHVHLEVLDDRYADGRSLLAVDAKHDRVVVVVGGGGGGVSSAIVSAAV